LAGREEKERWARNSPVWFRNPFFSMEPFLILYFNNLLQT
jgi:hypothetical protein